MPRSRYVYISELRDRLLKLAEEYMYFSKMRNEFLLALYEELDRFWKKGEITEGEYRQKGNVFRDFIIHLVWLRSDKKFKLRDMRVEGFTERHDLDLAYVCNEKLLVAGEVKMLGSPPHRRGGETKPERATRKDLDKRLKEVKFTPVDLKLKYTGTNIGDWRAWIKNSIPQFYSFWVCRIGKEDNAKLIIKKFKALRDWYNNGVGIFLFKEEDDQYIPLEVEEEELKIILNELNIDKTIDKIVEFLGSNV